MDLIYTNGQLKDLGVLQDYSFDMEYGKDSTNDFQCKVQQYNHVCDQDYLLYVEFTEYGGVIDRIESDTKSGEVTYKGRTWHGLLNSFVIEPPAGQIYRTFDGDANEVLAEIVELTGMTDLFEVDDTTSGVEINMFQCRYEKAYDLILRMLDSVNAKMYCYWKAGKVHIGALLSMNYAVSEEFDNTQVPFKVGLTYNNINHLICLGQGDGKDRAVIHLFCEDGGALRPYKKIENPLQDSDYILDKSQQVLFNREERTEIFDEPNAEITVNYILLSEQPSDWRENYHNHYYQIKVDDNGVIVLDNNGQLQFELVKQKFEDVYYLQYSQPSDWYVQQEYQNYYYWDPEAKDGQGAFAKVKELPQSEAHISYSLLTKKPVDWKTDYDNYYQYDATTQKYSAVQGNTIETYELVYKYEPSQLHPVGEHGPSDWKWNYGSYYTRSWDGVKWVYSGIQGKAHNRYDLQTKKPTDWNTNWGNYYVKLKAGEYQDGKKIKKYKAGWYQVSYAVNTAKVIAKQKGKDYPKWSKNKFHTLRVTYSAPDPDTITNGIFIKHTEEKAPTWQANRYYIRYVDTTPVWQAGTYYTLAKDVEQVPPFVAGQYYRAVEDRYAVLVADAIEKLQELRDTSTLDIDLELESNYDVGDIVGSIDNVTGIEVNKPILRKTIKIKKDIVSVEHSVD